MAIKKSAYISIGMKYVTVFLGFVYSVFLYSYVTVSFST